MNIVSRVIEAVGTQAALAAALGIKPQAVSQWINKGQIPAERCGRISTLTGIPLHDIRPDLFPDPQHLRGGDRCTENRREG